MTVTFILSIIPLMFRVNLGPVSHSNSPAMKGENTSQNNDNIWSLFYRTASDK